MGYCGAVFIVAFGVPFQENIGACLSLASVGVGDFIYPDVSGVVVPFSGLGAAWYVGTESGKFRGFWKTNVGIFESVYMVDGFRRFNDGRLYRADGN